MAHVAKYTRGALGHMLAHYERGKDKDGQYIQFGNEKIDTTRSYLNYNLAPNHNMSQGQFIKKRCSEVKCLNRKDVNVMCSWVITAPKDLDLSQEKDFFKESYKFLEDRYGVDNVISAYVHLDETTPHMHFSFVPVVYDNKKDCFKVSAKQRVSKSDLKAFHSDLQLHLDKSNIKCNILNDATKNGNKSIEELKRETAIKEINQKKTYLNILMLKIKEKEEELESLIQKERDLAILRNEDIYELDKKLELLIEGKKRELWNKIHSHENWLNSNGRIGKQLNLENENLLGMKLLNLDLRGANLINTDLSNCNIYADLRGANLTGANINNTKWTGSNINRITIEPDKLLEIEYQLKQNIDDHITYMQNLKIKNEMSMLHRF